MEEDEINFREDSYDASNPEAISEAKKRAKRKKHDRLAIVREMMNVPEGRAWLFELLDGKCHVFTANVSEGEHMARFEGERSVGLFILEDIMQAAEDKFPIMCKEGRSK
jgi:hypothetical protein